MKVSNYIYIFFLMLAVASCFGATYYVDNGHPSASDSNPGTIPSPWMTIQHSADELIPGDTVFIRSGEYNEQLISVRDGDSYSGPIVFAAYPSENPVIDGSGVVTGNNGVIIEHSFIELHGLEIRDWNDNGVWVVGAGHIVINDCEVHEVQYGIGFVDGAHNFELNRVVMHDFDLYGFDATPDGEACYNGVLNDCVSHTGRDPLQNVDGFALGHGDQRNFEMNRCVTYGVFDGFDISSRNTRLNECLSFDCWNGCYKLWQDSLYLTNCIGYGAGVSVVELDWDGDPGRVEMTNCTLFDSETFIVWIENAADTLHMTNCILAGADNIALCFEQPGTGNYSGDYNIFHTDDGWRAVTVAYTDEFSVAEIESGDWTAFSGQDTHSLAADYAESLFVDIASDDLHLLPTSIAIDNGTPDGAPEIDFDGNIRPNAAGYDIGAYEYLPGGGVGEATALPEDFEIRAYPNPFNSSVRIAISGEVTSPLQIEIYDVNGRKIDNMTVGDGFPVPSSNGRGDIAPTEVVWQPDESLGSGVYLVSYRPEGRATIPGNKGLKPLVLSKKVIYLK